MASQLYDSARQSFLRGEIAWESGDIRALLVKPSYTFLASHQFVSAVAASEISATNYARQVLSGKQVQGGAPTYAVCNNILWTSLGNGTNDTIGGVIIYLNTGSDATSRLIVFCDPNDLTTQGEDTTAEFENGRVFSAGG